jgi:hypothetical protein
MARLTDFHRQHASKSGDTNLDSVHTHPCLRAVKSMSSQTRIRPSDFFGFLLPYVKTQIWMPDTRIQFEKGRIQVNCTRIQHSEFLGVFASKSGDTNSDSFETDPPSVAVESESSGTRIRPSYFLFLLIYAKTQIRMPDTRIQFKGGRIRVNCTRIRMQ